MEIKPVNNIEKPKYPLKDEVTRETINSSLPKRWVSGRTVKIALGTLAAVSLAGCAVIKVPTAGVPLPPSATSEASFATASPDTSVYGGVPMLATIKVAPLFVHGEGRGAYGGDMASVPAFISEDEALAIINEAAKEYGLSFSSAEVPEFSNVLLPVTELSPDDTESSAEPSGKGTLTALKADFADSAHNIAIEYVSVEDIKKWSSGPSNATIEYYETEDTAGKLSEALEEADRGSYYTVAVLYDPCMHADKEKDAREMSETELKAQATDYFKWLHDQGII
jgi:hypothetical protein